MGSSRSSDGETVVMTPSATVMLSQDPSTRLALEKAETERRLKEAELKLAEAVAEIQRQKHRGHEEDGHVACGNIFTGRHPLCQHGDACFTHAAGSLIQSFLLAYGVRAGIGVLLRSFVLLRKRPAEVLDLQLLLSEKNLVIREEACRIGLLFGGFTGTYHFMRCLLRRLTNRESDANSFIAGSVAGLSLSAIDNPTRRRTFALYLLARVFQCSYNFAKSRGKWHFWGSHWQHGDTLLFALASAQVMYAYVMRPETLNNSYWEFIARTGPIAKPVLKAVKSTVRGESVDLAELTSYIRKVAPSRLPLTIGRQPKIIPCSVLHPDTSNCFTHNGNAMRSVFKKTFPLYMSLTFVPFVVLNLQKFTQAPLRTLFTATRSAIRSTTFLSAFVGIYQGVICMQRKFASHHHKSVYWFAGAFQGALRLRTPKGVICTQRKFASRDHKSVYWVAGGCFEQSYPAHPEGVICTQRKFANRDHKSVYWVAGAFAAVSLLLANPSGVICTQRKFASRDHKSVYWVAGAFAALSVLLEKKNRRAELALYVLPRAADSLWCILVHRRLLPEIRHAEVALFCLCMGSLMFYHENQPETMTPFLRGLITRFLNRTGIPDIPLSPLPPAASVHRRLNYLVGDPSPEYRPLDFHGEDDPASPGGFGSRIGSPGPHSRVEKEKPRSRDLYREGVEQVVEKLQMEAFQGLS